MQQCHATSYTFTASTLASPVPRTLRIVPTHDPLTDYSIRRDEYRVHVARSPTHLTQASRLVERMYSARGYHAAGVAPAAAAATPATIVASSGPEVRGTLTLRLDTGKGLLADALYADEIDRFRAQGGKVCELSRFAVSPEFSSKELIASLIQLAHVYARVINRASDAFIEVNPRHAPFYQRMLGFRRIGGVRTCSRVNAPAVLLHLGLAYMDEQIRKRREASGCRERSLYAYFLSRDPADWPAEAACAA